MRLLVAALALAASYYFSEPAPQSAPASRSVGASLYVLNKAEGSVSIVDAKSGAVRATVAVGVGPHEAAVAPGGARAVVCNYGAAKPGTTLTVIDAAARKAVKTIDLAPNRRPHGIVFLPDGKRALVTAEMEKKLLVVDVDSGAIDAAIETQQAGSHMVVASPDGKRAYVANIGSGSVTAIDLEKRAVLKVIPTGAEAEGIAMHPTRPEVWVGNRKADTVSVIDAAKLEVAAEIPCGKFPIRVVCTPDGKHALVSCAQSGDVAVIDAAKREVVRRVPMTAPASADAEGRMFAGQGGPVPVGILVSPDGAAAYVANTNADVIKVIDLATWTVTRELRGGKEPDGLAWVSESSD